jgi:hypothetical protein
MPTRNGTATREAMANASWPEDACLVRKLDGQMGC